MRRAERHIRHHRSDPADSVPLQPEGVHRAEAAGPQGLLGPDDTCVVHERSPRVYGRSGDGASQPTTFDMPRPGLPVDVVRAAERLRAHDLVLTQLREVWRDPDGLEAGPGARHLASASTDPVRALLVSAAHAEESPPVRSVMDDTPLTRIMTRARRRLRDRGLTPERIAAKHAIPVRRRYVLLSEAGRSLEQRLMQPRRDAPPRAPAVPGRAGQAQCSAVCRVSVTWMRAAREASVPRSGSKSTKPWIVPW
ncbi:hypothetical protein [Streptomyces sp. NPDC052721]|uniref:hypothetical protein n=1 Tax=Streptomyces sp. NPDC052721 TaxID=3154955 RepID=UPI0034368DC9